MLFHSRSCTADYKDHQNINDQASSNGEFGSTCFIMFSC